MEQRSSSEGSLTSSADDIEGKSSAALLEELASEYSRYLNFDVSKEQGKFAESIEAMLTRLDEFCGLVDIIRSDTSLCLNKTVPEIQAKCQEMRDTFDRIDRLESFVAVVKKDVTAMEDCLSKAEDELGSSNILKKISSFVSSKKSTSSNRSQQKPQFIPPHIFHTERFLGSGNTTVTTGSTTDVTTTHTTTSTSICGAEVTDTVTDSTTIVDMATAADTSSTVEVNTNTATTTEGAATKDFEPS